MTPSHADELLRQHADLIARTCRELAINFDIPAPAIIAGACREMGITSRQWDALQKYRIAREKAAAK